MKRLPIVLSLAVAAVVGLATTAEPPALAAFPGRNGTIAFRSVRDGNSEIYVMNADGSGAVNLTQSPANDLSPAWSPDGRKIAYITNRHDLASNSDYYVMNADGTGVTRLTTNGSGGGPPRPAWSPDGSRIAYDSRAPGKVGLWVMNADGSSQRQLTNGNDFSPDWSPDGAKIVYTRAPGGIGEEDIYAMNADGTGQTGLVVRPGYDFAPSWSPDGQRIVFSSSAEGNADIYVMNAEGSGQTRLTDHPAWDGGAVWSPDGQQIVFQSYRDGNSEIYVANADGSGLTRLTDHPAHDAVPHWQPVNPLYALTIRKRGTGAGTIRSLPGIDCGSDCTEEYVAGRSVTLTATAAAGSLLRSWASACSRNAPSCSVKMDAPKAVTAVFSRNRTTVAIASRSVNVTRTRLAPVKLRRGAEACRGVLTLIFRKLTIGSKSFSIAAGRSATVKVRLTVRGFKALVRARRLRAQALIRYRQPSGATTKATRAITLTAPKR